MIGANSEPRRQLSTTAARENACSAAQVTSVQCRRWRPSRNRIFCDQSYFCTQFQTDFDSQNRCLCSRSHGPLLRAFCLCFHFKMSMVHTHTHTSMKQVEDQKADHIRVVAARFLATNKEFYNLPTFWYFIIVQNVKTTIIFHKLLYHSWLAKNLVRIQH